MFWTARDWLWFVHAMTPTTANRVRVRRRTTLCSACTWKVTAASSTPWASCTRRTRRPCLQPPPVEYSVAPEPSYFEQAMTHKSILCSGRFENGVVGSFQGSENHAEHAATFFLLFECAHVFDKGARMEARSTFTRHLGIRIRSVCEIHGSHVVA